MKLPRSSGVLLHPTSLPGGRLGDEAYRFVDWLAAAGQSWWQILPLTPPDETGSPYFSASAFAGSPGLLADPRARVSAEEIEDFVARHPAWIGDWAAFAGGSAVADQVRFEREWSALRSYAAEHGVRVIGDLPIYVAPASADHRMHPELFQEGFVAGVPPDAYTPNGQLWGNPLYDWPAHRATGFHWWVERFRRVLELVDVARIDHFRGLVAYWAVPEGRKTARRGRWRPAPGHELLATVERELGGLPVIAEDLGLITPPVRRLRDEFGLPGMVVMHWAFGGGRNNPHRLANHRENQVVYTATHDNDTTVGWFRTAAEGGADAHRARPARAELVADRPRLVVPCGPGDHAGAGRARPRQRGAHEPPRHGRRQLAVAAAPRPADRAARRTAARRDGSLGAALEDLGAPGPQPRAKQRVGALDGARGDLLDAPRAFELGEGPAAEKGRAQVGDVQPELGVPAALDRAGPALGAQRPRPVVPVAERVADVEGNGSIGGIGAAAERRGQVEEPDPQRVGRRRMCRRRGSSTDRKSGWSAGRSQAFTVVTRSTPKRKRQISRVAAGVVPIASRTMSFPPAIPSSQLPL